MENLTYFNRHESMDSETRSIVLNAIRDLFQYDSIQNYLYGSFDGYNYSKIALNSEEFKTLLYDDFDLGYRVYTIFKKLDTYKKTKLPNENQF